MIEKISKEETKFVISVGKFEFPESCTCVLFKTKLPVFHLLLL